MMSSSAIKIGARTYAIASLSDEDFDVLLSRKIEPDGDIKSFIDYDEQLIVVRGRLRPDHKRELIIHELIHACVEDAGLQQEEGFIRSIAARLNSLIDENLFDVLREVCHETTVC